MNKFASGSALHDWREGLAVPIPDQEASLLYGRIGRTHR